MATVGDTDLFAGLTATEEDALRARLRARRYPPGAVILRQGHLSGELHVIRSGAVSVTAADALGRASELARLGPGQCVGEMSLLTGEPHSATVTAAAPTETLVLGRDDFLALLADSPGLARNISRILSERLLRANRRQVAAERATVVAIASPLLPAAAPALALNLAVSLARQARGRVLLAVDEATLDGPLRPLRCAALPGLDEVARDPGAVAAHAAAEPGHPALAGARLCAVGAGYLEAALAALAPVYDQIVVAAGAGGDWAAGATRALLLAPAGRVGAATMARAVASAAAAGAAVGVVATDLGRAPSAGERERLGARVGAPVLRGLPVALGALADTLLPPLVRRDRAGAGAAGIDWLARDIAGLKVGVAFGAGSARGYAHLGVLRVLAREGVPLDVLAGTSIGAIVAGFAACGLTIEEIAEEFVAVGRRLLAPGVPYSSLFSNRYVRAAIRRSVGARRIEDLAEPFAAVAVDLVTSEPVVLRRGPLWRALLASAAIPGIFPPVVHLDRALIDGVVRDPLPTDVVAGLGADVVLGVRLSPQREQLVPTDGAAARPNLLDVVSTMLDVMQEAIESHGSQRADLVIHPALGKVTLRQFKDGLGLIEAGEAAAEEALPALRRLLPWLGPGD